MTSFPDLPPGERERGIECEKDRETEERLGATQRERERERERETGVGKKGARRRQSER